MRRFGHCAIMTVRKVTVIPHHRSGIPIGDSRAGFNDEQAIGLTFNFDRADGKESTITYHSGNPSVAKGALVMPFAGSPVSVTFRELGAGAIEATYGPGPSTDAALGYGLPLLLGHGIAV